MQPESAPDLPADPQPDEGRTAPVTTHVGVLVPWANTVVEEELPRLSSNEVVLHYARLVPPSHTTALDKGFLDGLRAAVPTAVASLNRLPLDAIFLACTSEGFTRTTGKDEEVISAFDALTTALAQFGATRIALATPYPEPITQREADAFDARGIEVTAHASLGRDDGYPDVAACEIISLVEGLNPRALAAADVLVLSCTGWPTRGVLAILEQQWRMPVLSSNLAMALHTTTVHRKNQQ